MSAIIIKDPAGFEYVIPVASIAFIERSRAADGTFPTIVLSSDVLPSRITTRETFERLTELLGVAYSQGGVLFYDNDGDIAITHGREK